MVIELVLLADLLIGAGDDERSGFERAFLGLNPGRELVGLLAGLALGLEPQLLDAAERVPGENEGDAE